MIQSTSRHDDMLKLESIYAEALYADDGATLDDLREAVETLEETKRTARRVMGGAHPLTIGIEDDLREARATLALRFALHSSEAPPGTGTP